MKKLYVAVALLLVVVAIAYIKSARGTARQQQVFELGQTESRNQLAGGKYVCGDNVWRLRYPVLAGEPDKQTETIFEYHGPRPHGG